MQLARALLAFLAFAAALTGRAAERSVERVFAVEPGGLLAIDTHRGAIIITESDQPQITVAVRLEIGADDEAEADRMAAGLRLDFRQEGNTVSVFARNPPESVRWHWEDKKQIDLTYRVSVPRRTDVELKNILGSITVGNLEGRMAAQLDTGTIFFRAITGSVEARVSSGEIIVSRCSGALTAQIQEGLLRIGTVGGPMKLRNGSGDIEIGSAGGPVEARTAAGNIFVSFPREIGGPADILSSGGNVIATLAPEAVCRIEASTTWGKITNQLPLAIEAGGNNSRKLFGRLNGGTTPLVLRAHGGYLKLEQGWPQFDGPRIE